MNDEAVDKPHLKLVYSSDMDESKTTDESVINTQNSHGLKTNINIPDDIVHLKGYKKPKNIIFVASGKGGVGKTWFTVNLAQILASWGKKILICDADFSFANVDVQLGLLPDHDLTQAINGVISFREAITRYHLGEFDVIAGATMSGSFNSIDVIGANLVWNNLAKISHEYDLVFVDMGNCTDGTASGVFEIANNGIMVTTDEPSSLSDVYTMMKFIHDNHQEVNLDIVVNKVDNYTAGNVTFTALESVTKSFLNFTPNLLGIVRNDHMVVESIRNQVTTFYIFPSIEKH